MTETTNHDLRLIAVVGHLDGDEPQFGAYWVTSEDEAEQQLSASIRESEDDERELYIDGIYDITERTEPPLVVHSPSPATIPQRLFLIQGRELGDDEDSVGIYWGATQTEAVRDFYAIGLMKDDSEIDALKDCEGEVPFFTTHVEDITVEAGAAAPRAPNEIRLPEGCRTHIMLDGLGSITVNRTHEGVIIDVFNTVDGDSIESVALENRDFAQEVSA